MPLINCASDCRLFWKARRFKNVSDRASDSSVGRAGLVDQNAFLSADASPSPFLLLLPPLRLGGEAGQQMAGPYPSASDEWRMMSSRAWQALVYVHKGGFSFWGHAAGLLPIFKSTWQIFNGGSWIYVSDDFFCLIQGLETEQSPKTVLLWAEFWGHTQSASTLSINRCRLKHACLLIVSLNIVNEFTHFYWFSSQRRTQCAPQQPETATRGCHWPDRPCLRASRHHFSSQMAYRL